MTESAAQSRAENRQPRLRGHYRDIFCDGEARVRVVGQFLCAQSDGGQQCSRDSRARL